MIAVTASPRLDGHSRGGDERRETAFLYRCLIMHSNGVAAGQIYDKYGQGDENG